jgi:hypothetical protein
MKYYLSAIILSLVLSLQVFATDIYSSREGEYLVKLPSVNFSFTCSYVILDITSQKNVLRISTNFDCEDGEDQEFGGLYLEMSGEKLFYKNVQVGFISKNELFVQVPDGRGFEIYHLKWKENGLHYYHNSSYTGRGHGTLKAVLQKI